MLTLAWPPGAMAIKFGVSIKHTYLNIFSPLKRYNLCNPMGYDTFLIFPTPWSGSGYEYEIWSVVLFYDVDCRDPLRKHFSKLLIECKNGKRNFLVRFFGRE